jgi:hypothetical protein
MNYLSPGPWLVVMPLAPFSFFAKIRVDIRTLRCTSGVNDTGGTVNGENVETEFATGVDASGNF